MTDEDDEDGPMCAAPVAIRDVGDCKFDHINSANVPVDIWLTPVEADHNRAPMGARWQLTAALYMPRKGMVVQEAFCAYAVDREQLTAVVREKILPLYRTAVACLESIAAGTDQSLYYWDPPGGEAVDGYTEDDEKPR